MPRTPDPVAPSALRGATMATGLVLAAAAAGVAVRVLPWALDPRIAWPVLAPFAKSLLSVAAEAAVLTGWPVGWALAAQRTIDRGEARVLASLGEAPGRTLSRLFLQGALLAAVLAVTSMSLGKEAAAPGRVVNALLSEGRAACSPGMPSSHTIPFVSAAWLCFPEADTQPRLAGRAPLGNVVFTATDARATDDLRRIDLRDAELTMPASAGQAFGVRVRVSELALRGLPPWARASGLPPAFRALVVTASAIAAAAAAFVVLLRMRDRRIPTAAAFAVGAAGPLAALAALRGLEVRMPDTPPGGIVGAPWLLGCALVPMAALAAVIGTSTLLAALPMTRRTGSR